MKGGKFTFGQTVQVQLSIAFTVELITGGVIAIQPMVFWSLVTSVGDHWRVLAYSALAN